MFDFKPMIKQYIECHRDLNKDLVAEGEIAVPLTDRGFHIDIISDNWGLPRPVAAFIVDKMIEGAIY